MKQHLYLVSTPLHLFMATNVALTRPEDEHYLLFIDQKEVEQNPYFTVVQDWPLSPFKSVDIFPGRFKGWLQKWQGRKQIFKALDDLIEQLRPDVIYVGNDRRIEFQYAMHLATHYKDVIGAYLDEGTYTYVGREASSSLSDQVIDNAIKKLTYGFWWKNPPTIGGSDWISEIYVAFPELIHPLLKSKRCLAIETEGFLSPAMSQLADKLCELEQLDVSALQGIQVLVSLPFESIYQQQPAYREVLVAMIDALYAKGISVGVKYHPRDSIEDGLQLFDLPGVVSIPSKVNFEALLTRLPQCVVLGDVSSVLLLCRWLRPELKVLAIDTGNNPLLSQFESLYQSLEIPVSSLQALEVNLNRLMGSE